MQYRNEVTDNAALVEIKTPQTPLLGGLVDSDNASYRNNAYNVSRELSGATQQLLAARDLLIKDYHQLVGDEDPQFRVFNPKALLIIGDSANLPRDRTATRSFEHYRNNLREVDVITFDELAGKIRRLTELLDGRS